MTGDLVKKTNILLELFVNSVINAFFFDCLIQQMAVFILMNWISWNEMKFAGLIKLNQKEEGKKQIYAGNPASLDKINVN